MHQAPFEKVTVASLAGQNLIGSLANLR